MIINIKIDGFKSLSSFELGLTSGINILVGPNGSGKTNIISFFEFLGFLQGTNVSNAISNAGGAGSVFRKIGTDTIQSSMISSIVGSVKLGSKKYIYYEYDFEIKIHGNLDHIFYSHQRLKLKYRTVDTIKPKKFDSYDLDIERNVDRKLQPVTKIRKLDRRRIKTRHFLYEEKLTKKEMIGELCEFSNDYMSNEDSLVENIKYRIQSLFAIARDITGGKVFNIEPSKVRIPEDSAKNPGILKDGSGLYATLYAISKYDKKPRRRFFSRTERNLVSDTSLAEIERYIKLANDTIEKIDVFNDQFDNQLKVRIGIKGEKETALLPLSSMSDGTIKWMSLITILLTHKSIISIEEPENYLHPLMQSEIMRIMRSTTENRRFILMSTHSETLLNSAKPHEIIVVSFLNGSTVAHRPKNVDDINAEIQRTGFGLGYYYLAGNLEDE